MQKPTLDIPLMEAIVTLADELSYTNAAKILDMSQSGLSRRIQVAERRLNRRLFERDRANVLLTDAGRTCVEECRLAIEHEERAIRFTKAISQNIDCNLSVGRSQYADPLLIDVLLSLHLPMHPNLDIQLHSEFAPELVHDVLSGRLDLALVTHPEVTPRLSTVKLTEAPFHVLMPDDHPLAHREKIKIRDLTENRWVVFDRRAHPALYKTLMDRANEDKVEMTALSHVLSAEEASHMVTKNGGVAFMTKAGAFRVSKQGLVVKPLHEPSLRLDVHLAARADNQSRLVSEFFRTFVKTLKSVLEPSQMSLPISMSGSSGGR